MTADMGEMEEEEKGEEEEEEMVAAFPRKRREHQTSVGARISCMYFLVTV